MLSLIISALQGWLKLYDKYNLLHISTSAMPPGLRKSIHCCTFAFACGRVMGVCVHYVYSTMTSK